MNLYTCFRCGYKDNYKGNVKKHLNRKNLCKPTLTNISKEECLKVLKIKDYKLVADLILDEKNKASIDGTIIDMTIKDNIIKELEEEISKYTKSIKINTGNMKDEFIYILQEREFVKSNEEIYKIGKTRGLRNRMGDYPRGSKIKLVFPCYDCDDVEKELLKMFDITFTKRRDIGIEYYQGDLKNMTNIASSYINEKHLLFNAQMEKNKLT
jgi:hypothetical protein